ncbi:AAA domain-containing protein [Clostridium butyricum]|uniref:AAA domain-containing protein n=1 Tax=Clostridium butyricum TaxID=1492 RepID=UPI003F91BF9C
MNEILEKYKERLINLSGSNRALVCKKLPKKRAFDLWRLKRIDENMCINIIEFIFSEKQGALELLPDYTELFNKKEKSMRSEIKSEYNSEVEIIKNLKLESTEEKNRISSLKENYENRINKEVEKLNKERDMIIDFSVSLKALWKEIDEVNKETGRMELYIGYPFVEGNLKDKTFIKAPLFLFPVSLAKCGDSWEIENVNESSVMLNKVLLLGIAKHNEIKIPSIDTEYEKISKTQIDEILKNLEKENIFIKYEHGEIQKFEEYNSNTIPDYNLGTLMCKENLVIGQFSIANSIYNDYEALLNIDIQKNILEELLNSNYDTEKAKEEDDSKLTFEEKDINLISGLDYSQEKAVSMADKTTKMVIYGPPGTGKSQTIVNIIGDALSKGKKVLMVSQKRAALDVIYNRLESLNKKAVIIHDANGDKKGFYAKTACALEEITYDNKDYVDLISDESRSIDVKIRNLEKIQGEMFTKREYGLTLQEMYEKCKNINSREDSRYDEFLRFRKINSFSSYKYHDLKEALEKIDDEYINDYSVYRKLENENPFIDDIDLSMNLMDIDEFAIKVKKIIEPVKKITDKCDKNKVLYDSLMNLYTENNYVIDDSKVEKLANELNKNENSYLLDKINDGKWWSVRYWINYSKNKNKENENKSEFETRKRALIEEIKVMASDIDKAFEEIAIVKKALSERVYNIVIGELLKGEDLTQYFKDVIGALNATNDYKEVLHNIRGLNKIHIDILSYVFDKDLSISKNRLNSLLEFVTLNHILDIEKEAGIKEITTYINNFDGIVNSVNAIMKEKQNNVRNYIIDKWNKKASEISSFDGYKEFKRQANKKRALWPIRRYMDEYYEMVLNLFPCFLLSPETVSEILPLKDGMFDMVIFDEASQMYIENAIPTIFRGNQVIVAGDDKQLRPNGTFSNRYIDEEENDGEENRAALEEESLLDLAKINYDPVSLMYHYRSRYEELINFSNYAFYGGKLKISPNLSYDEDNLPMERIKVDGRWIDRENLDEAEEVCNTVYKILKERKNNESVGIITFNISQKNCIENCLERKAQNDSEFATLYTKEIDRVENDEDISMFVKNIENVQGDERDIIIFSIGYAQNEKGRVSVNFGSLSQDGGENRLNVAISRAKKKIYVVTSIEPEELSVDDSKNKGPKLFKKYLQYVKAVSENNNEYAKQILKNVLDSEINAETDNEFDSDFEIEVCDKLRERGYEVHNQIGVSGYRIDLGIYDSKESKYILGIECDGAAYHGSKSARERDIHRQRYLESRGWNIIRIWSKHWWNNPDFEIRRIEDEVDRIKKIIYS